jgi:hypothetical protein
MAKRTVKKIDHSKNLFEAGIITNQQIGRGLIRDMIEFKYRSDEVYDKLPVVYVIRVDTNIIEGININYLNDFTISKLMKEATIKKLTGWEFYHKAYRSYSRKNIMGKIKLVSYIPNKGLSTERDRIQEEEQGKQGTE